MRLKKWWWKNFPVLKSLLFKPNNKETRTSSVDAVLVLLLFTLNRCLQTEITKDIKVWKRPHIPRDHNNMWKMWFFQYENFWVLIAFRDRHQILLLILSSSTNFGNEEDKAQKLDDRCHWFMYLIFFFFSPKNRQIPVAWKNFIKKKKIFLPVSLLIFLRILETSIYVVLLLSVLSMLSSWNYQVLVTFIFLKKKRYVKKLNKIK